MNDISFNIGYLLGIKHATGVPFGDVEDMKKHWDYKQRALRRLEDKEFSERFREQLEGDRKLEKIIPSHKIKYWIDNIYELLEDYKNSMRIRKLQGKQKIEQLRQQQELKDTKKEIEVRKPSLPRVKLPPKLIMTDVVE